MVLPRKMTVRQSLTLALRQGFQHEAFETLHSIYQQLTVEIPTLAHMLHLFLGEPQSLQRLNNSLSARRDTVPGYFCLLGQLK